MGKTYWLSSTFAGKRIYVRNGYGKYPYDSYQSEEVIAFDDCSPKLDELLIMSNTYQIRTRVYGETRYHERFMEPGSVRLLVVLHNQHPDEVYHEHTELRRSAFWKRFILIEMI